MIPDRPAIPPAQDGANSRRHGRVLCEGIGSSVGIVLDLSASGMRVRLSIKPPPVGSAIPCIIDGVDGPIHAPVRVVWTRKAGLFKHEAGVEFLELDPPTRSALAAVARCMMTRDGSLRIG